MAIYMEVEGINGSATESNHMNWIPIKSLDFPVTRPGVQTTPGKVTDRLRSAVDFEDITVTKDGDKSSPGIMRWMVDGLTKKVVIAICKEKGEEVMTMELEAALATNFSASASADEMPTETLKIDFTKIKMVWTTYDKANKKSGVVPVNYNLETAKAS